MAEQQGEGSVRVSRPGYWAFISYSHRDSRWADWLHKSLESYRIPRQLVGKQGPRGAIPKRLAPVFRDREELPSATDLGGVIRDALERSTCQIVICSPRAAKSRWVNEEILAFKRLGREDRIFCLIVDGEPNASDDPAQADQECFPSALRFRLSADGELSETRTEPIAADARPGKDGKSNAKLKLIAGMLGVGFDALRRREQQRRNRRLFAITCAATIGMVVTSGLATYALIERRAAERQTARAEAEAETARQTTSFLVDLFRISDPSEARGNAVTAREMLDKGAARVDRELASQPSIRATLMDTLGTVYMGLGLYRQARPLLDSAVSTRRATDAAQSFALSVAQEHRADLLTLQADYDGAEKAYREALALQTAPDLQARAARAKSLYGLGIVLEQKGRYADAERTLRQALEQQRALYGGMHGDIARTLKDLARVMAEGGKLNDALPVMRSALAMQRQLRGAEPHPDLAEALNDLALLLEQHGDFTEAEDLYVQAIAMKRRLLGEKHPEIALGLNNLATVLQDRGDLAGAESAYREALAMQRELLGDVHPDVALTLNNLAFVQSDRGDARGALATEREALAVYQKLFPYDHPEVARVMNRIGFWLTEAGEYGEADRDLQTALAMRRRLLGNTHPDVGTSLFHLAILQIALHKYAEGLTSARGALDILTPALSASHWKTAVAESAEAAALTGLGQYAEAQPLLTHSLEILGRDTAAPREYQHLAQRYLETLRVRARQNDGSRVSSVRAAL
jgi:tetratricopeptide (TPR) repeat protein